MAKDRPHQRGVQGREGDDPSESSERWWLLVGSLRDTAILRLDNAGKVTLWDESAERLLGHSPDAAAGLSLSELYPEEQALAGVPQEHLRAARESGMHEDEGWRRRADGTLLWATVALTTLPRGGNGDDGFMCVVRDVTQKRQTEDELRATEEGFRMLVESVKDYAIFLLDPGGRVSSWNAGAERTLGYVADDIVGRHWSALYLGRDAELGRPGDHLETAIADGRCEIEGWRMRSDGSVIWAHVAVAPLRRGDGTVRGFSCVIGDLTERRRSEAELAHRALHDPLTGLANRDLLSDRLAQALARSERDREGVGVIFLDLDRFKAVNDTMGHGAGDELLVLLAGRLRGAVRAGDTVARFSGDEFVVLCERLQERAEALTVVHRLGEAMKRPFAIGTSEVTVSASIGIALAEPGEETTPEALLRDADAALYAAKRAGRGGYAIFDERVRSQAAERRGVERDLRDALSAHQLHVDYQPQVMLDTGRLARLEALVRWNHPVRGLVAPVEFIPLAEENGFIDEIGSFVLEDACRVAREWGEDGVPLPVAINVSAVQLARSGFTGAIRRALDTSGLPPSMLCVEITESVLMDAAGSAGLLLELKALGVQIAIDDFGTGYSSLSYLRRFPVSILKIDRSFVENLEAGASDRAIVAAMVSMGHALGLEVVAEGVETEWQRDILRELGCDAAQGYLFSPALAPERLPALLEGLPPLGRGRAAPGRAAR